MDGPGYMRFLGSLTLVIGMIFAMTWLLRRHGAGLLGTRMTRGAGRRRLGVVEALPLDARRRLVLVRRDDREHLLLLGADGDMVVERDCAQPRFQVPSAPPEEGS